MLKKSLQIFFLVLLLSSIAIIQFSFIFSLPAVFSQINLAVIVLVFTLFFFDFRSSMYAALIIGFWLDMFSFYFFGLHIIILLATAALANWILKAWLTNRALYSFLLLILIATAAYAFGSGFLFYLSGVPAGGFFLWSGTFWSNLGYQIFWSELAGILMFSLAGVLTRRFKPFFLEKK